MKDRDDWLETCDSFCVITTTHTYNEQPHLCAVLLPGGRHVIYVWLSWRLKSGRNVVFILVWFHCVVHIHLSNTGRNYHLNAKAQRAQRQVCQSKMTESCSCMTNINLITQPEIIYIQFRPWKSLNAYNKNISAQTKINSLSVCCFFTLNEQTLKGAQSHQNMLPTHRCTWGNKNSAMAQS